MTETSPLLDLTELIAVLGDPDIEVDIDSAVSRLADVLDADVVAICGREAVESSYGLERERRPGELLMRLARESSDVADIAGMGELNVVRTTLERAGEMLLLLRGSSSFSADELRFVRAVGRVLGLSLRMRKSVSAERAAQEHMQRRADDNRRLVDQLRERQGLLDRLFRIQRSISHRAPTNDVLDAITAGASELLGVERVELRLHDQDSHADLVLVSSIGVEADAGDGPDFIRQLMKCVPRLSSGQGCLATGFKWNRISRFCVGWSAFMRRGVPHLQPSFDRVFVLRL